MRAGLTNRLDRLTTFEGRTGNDARWVASFRAVAALVTITPVIAWVVLGYQRRWTTEDAFISFRVVDQILAGNGAVFNAGERVESHTNALWVAILSVVGLTGVDLALAAMVMGLVFSGIGLFAGIQAARQRLVLAKGDKRESARLVYLPFGVLVFVALPVAWDFATSGLETGLTFGWLGTAYWALVRSAAVRSIPTSFASSVLIGVGPLIRPDLALYSAGFLVAFVYLYLSADRARSWRGATLLLGAAAAIPVAYQIFRMGYYAALVPNTAFAKEASSSHWHQGWLYLVDFVEPYRLWLPLAAVLGYWAVSTTTLARRADWRGVALLVVPVLTGTLHTLYVARVGGDFMHGRLLLPALFALLLPLFVVDVPLDRRSHLALSAATVLVLLTWSVVAATSLRPPYGAEIDEATQVIDERAYYTEDAGHPNPVTLDDYASVDYRWIIASEQVREQSLDKQRTIWIDGEPFPLRDSVPASIRYAVTRDNIGIFGHATGTSVHIVDLNGLADPVGARMELADRGRPGHEKDLPVAWAKARFAQPDIDALNERSVALARASLECGELGQLVDAVTEPLTPQRFLKNMLLSVELHDVRIPPAPEDAFERFCGRG